MIAALPLPEPHRIALHQLLDLQLPEHIHWAITGSAGLRLQGVAVPVRDLDIQTDRAGVDGIVNYIRKDVVEAPKVKESLVMRSYYGVAMIAAVKVELMGDIQHRLPDGSWDAPIEIIAFQRWVVWEGRSVPVLDLHYEAQAYGKMGRQNKADAIFSTLKAMGESKDG